LRQKRAERCVILLEIGDAERDDQRVAAAGIGAEQPCGVALRSMARRMSSRRSTLALCGTEALAQNALAQLGAKGVLCQKIDGSSEPLFELSLEADQGEETDGMVELDDEVEVAIVTRFTPRDRAEQEE
jgi:hypothetical protein